MTVTSQTEWARSPSATGRVEAKTDSLSYPAAEGDLAHSVYKMLIIRCLSKITEETMRSPRRSKNDESLK